MTLQNDIPIPSLSEPEAVNVSPEIPDESKTKIDHTQSIFRKWALRVGFLLFAAGAVSSCDSEKEGGKAKTKTEQVDFAKDLDESEKLALIEKAMKILVRDWNNEDHNYISVYDTSKGAKEWVKLQIFNGDKNNPKNLIKTYPISDIAKLHKSNEALTKASDFKFNWVGLGGELMLEAFDPSGKYLIANYYINSLPDSNKKEEVKKFIEDKLVPALDHKLKEFKAVNKDVLEAFKKLDKNLKFKEPTKLGKFEHQLTFQVTPQMTTKLFKVIVEPSKNPDNDEYYVTIRVRGWKRLKFKTGDIANFEAALKTEYERATVELIKEKDEHELKTKLEADPDLAGYKFGFNNHYLYATHNGFVVNAFKVDTKKLKTSTADYDKLKKKLSGTNTNRVKNLNTIKNYLESEFGNNFSYTKLADQTTLNRFHYELKNNSGETIATVTLMPVKNTSNTSNQFVVLITNSTGKVITTVFGDNSFPIGNGADVSIADLQRIYGTGIASKIEEGETDESKKRVEKLNEKKTLVKAKHTLEFVNPDFKYEFVRDASGTLALRPTKENSTLPQFIYAYDLPKDLSDLAKIEAFIKFNVTGFATIEGRSWTDEVGDFRDDRNVARRSYLKKHFKRTTKKDADEALEDPSKLKLQKFEDLKGYYTINGDQRTIGSFLDTYFQANRNIKRDSDKLDDYINHNTILALYYLSQQKDAKGRFINVDYNQEGWRLEIFDGRLYIYDMQNNDDVIVNGAYLLKPPAGTDPSVHVDRKEYVKEYYRKLAKKHGIDDPDAVLDNPEEYGFLPIEKLKDNEINYLRDLEKKLFEKSGIIDEKRIKREKALTFYYMAMQILDAGGIIDSPEGLKENYFPDFYPGYQIESIRKGCVKFVNLKNPKDIKYVYLRKPKAGTDWEAQLGNVKTKDKAKRQQFYSDFVKSRKISDPDAALNDPKKYGLTTYDELKKATVTSKNPSSLGLTLAYIIGAELGITDRETELRELSLMLYYLTLQQDTKGNPINVDYIQKGWTIEIKHCQLFIKDKDGKYIVKGAFLKKPVL